MANFSLNFGTAPGGDTDILSGSIDWTRSGQYAKLNLYSDRKDIETTMSTFEDPETDTLSDSLPLEENYDTDLEATWTTDLSLTDTDYNDVYVRYAIKSDSDRLKDVDEESGNSPRGYREFRDNLVLFQDLITPTDSDKNQMTAYGFLETEEDTWERLKEVQFDLKTDNTQDAPSVFFMAKAAQVDAAKDKQKVLTTTIKGFTRQRVESIDAQPTLTDFVPFLVMIRPEYQYQIVADSYRESPTGSQKTGPGVDDGLEMILWTADTVSRLRQQNVQVSLILDGDFEIDDGGTDRPIEVGDFLEIIAFQYANIGGVSAPLSIDAPVLDVQYDPENDNTTIMVGKV